MDQDLHQSPRVSRQLPSSIDMGQSAGLKTAPQVTATYRRIAKGLTSGQLDALLLVGQHLTSNEIASVLGISRHTVDQRIRMAMRSLGVKGRRHAARIVVEKYGPIFKWTTKCDEPFVLPTAIRKTRLSRSALADPLTATVPPFEAWNVPSIVIRVLVLVWGSVLATGIYLAGLGSLGRLVHY